MTTPDELRQRERDLYLRMLDLGGVEDVEAFLREALTVAVDVSGARRGYLALYAPEDPPAQPPRFRLHRGFSDAEVHDVEGRVSQGIIAASRMHNRVINLPSAVLSPEWGSRESVVENDVHAVLCAPIGERGCGALYLEGEAHGSRTFRPEDEAMVAIVARHLGPLSDRLLLRLTLERHDPTSRFRTGGRFADFAGHSPQLAKVLEKATLYAQGQGPILLTGPTGTGKTELAREIHRVSPRASGPFVVFDLSVQHPSLIEQHLFGAEPGAYTDRRTALPGAIADARGGTLFLDEIGDLPLALQARLLRLIEEGRYTRLGSTKELVADVRVLAATNRDPEAEVRAGAFRRDLFHRLNAFPIALPSVDERPQDIPVLLDAVGVRVARRLDVPWPGLTPGARLAAEARSWDGNVREMRNLLERALLRTRGEAPLDAQVLLDQDDEPDQDGLPSWERANRSFQRAFLIRALEANGWSNRATYASIKLSKSRYFELLKELDIQPPNA